MRVWVGELSGIENGQPCAADHEAVAIDQFDCASDPDEGSVLAFEIVQEILLSVPGDGGVLCGEQFILAGTDVGVLATDEGAVGERVDGADVVVFEHHDDAGRVVVRGAEGGDGAVFGQVGAGDGDGDGARAKDESLRSDQDFVTVFERKVVGHAQINAVVAAQVFEHEAVVVGIELGVPFGGKGVGQGQIGSFATDEKAAAADFVALGGGAAVGLHVDPGMARGYGLGRRHGHGLGRGGAEGGIPWRIFVGGHGGKHFVFAVVGGEQAGKWVVCFGVIVFGQHERQCVGIAGSLGQKSGGLIVAIVIGHGQ